VDRLRAGRRAAAAQAAPLNLKRAAAGVALMALAGLLTVLAIGQILRGPTNAPAIAPAIADAPSTAAAPVTEAAPPTERTLTRVPALGRATAYVPQATATRVVLFISGEGELSPQDTARATRLASSTLVVVVSFDSLKKAQGTPQCWYPAGVLEEIARNVEQQVNLPEYHSPALVGVGAGASLAFAAIAQAPAGTFAGGVGLGFSGALPTNRPLCAAPGWKPGFDTAAHVARVPKTAGSSLEWRDLGAAPPEPATLSEAVAGVFAAAERPASKAPPPTASAADLERRLAALKLSLDDTWAEHPKASLIFMSGDGGWRDIDRQLAAYLAPRGVNVIGLSSAVYLWKAKTPPEGGADLRKMADIVADAQVPIFVGGYSIGAEVVPFFLDAWPEADRKRVAGQVLIAPSATATFAWSFSNLDWVPFHKEKATPYRVADPIRRAGVPVFCLTGTTVPAANTACSGVEDIATVVKLPGDHHFNGAYGTIGAAVMTFIQKYGG
jgi:type IV secretory pathway VirJ component